jgi:hypothetical protein
VTLHGRLDGPAAPDGEDDAGHDQDQADDGSRLPAITNSLAWAQPLVAGKVPVIGTTWLHARSWRAAVQWYPPGTVPNSGMMGPEANNTTPPMMAMMGRNRVVVMTGWSVLVVVT